MLSDLWATFDGVSVLTFALYNLYLSGLEGLRLGFGVLGVQGVWFMVRGDGSSRGSGVKGSRVQRTGPGKMEV